MKTDNIQLGKYLHYKTNKIYEMLGIARHTETHEEMIIYKALYDCEQFGNNAIWVRPKEMFFEKLLINGTIVPRFKYIGD